VSVMPEDFFLDHELADDFDDPSDQLLEDPR
jgi:hypothetical protein